MLKVWNCFFSFFFRKINKGTSCCWTELQGERRTFSVVTIWEHACVYHLVYGFITEVSGFLPPAKLTRQFFFSVIVIYASSWRTLLEDCGLPWYHIHTRTWNEQEFPFLTVLHQSFWKMISRSKVLQNFNQNRYSGNCTSTTQYSYSDISVQERGG